MTGDRGRTIRGSLAANGSALAHLRQALRLKHVIAVAMVLAVPATLAESEWYVGGSVGSVSQDDSVNSGAFTADFTTGDSSPAVPNGTVLPAGTSVGWNTEYDSGMAFSFEGGKKYASGFRSGLELSYGEADVDSHAGVARHRERARPVLDRRALPVRQVTCTPL